MAGQWGSGAAGRRGSRVGQRDRVPGRQGSRTAGQGRAAGRGSVTARRQRGGATGRGGEAAGQWGSRVAGQRGSGAVGQWGSGAVG
ncbi:hypothetical protein Pmani_031199 [Petrolisthes manimaculis]|uniref:Uncharacterized protein n=1 Tax=Petrolisthes manimaculis TaxID=1843537 RepID=A0AAE1TS81_9EUCA|nr:hypothetical protein Pmani_031199 [Petrolisthes manimaculis]